jgi:hypothetical protein
MVHWKPNCHSNFPEFTFILGGPLESVKLRFHCILNLSLYFAACVVQIFMWWISDLVYDLSLFPVLSQAFSHLLHKRSCVLLLACTVRNEETLNAFIQLLSKYCSLTVSGDKTLVSPCRGQHRFSLTELLCSPANSLFHCVLEPFITIPKVCDRPDPPLSRTHSERIYSHSDSSSFKNIVSIYKSVINTMLKVIFWSRREKVIEKGVDAI